MLKKVIIIIAIVTSLVIVGVIIALVFESYSNKNKLDYTGYKEIQLTDNIHCKIPENWEFGYKNDVLCIYETIDGLDKIYLVQGSVEGIGNWGTCDFIHPYWGAIELKNEIESWDYSDLGQCLYHGDFQKDNSELIKLYAMQYYQKNFYLLSFEPADEEIIVKIFYSLW